MKNLAKSVAVICIFTAGAAGAQEYYSNYGPEGSGLYFRAAAGPSFFQNGWVKEYGGPISGSKLRYDTGGTFSGAVGYAFNKYVAADFETGFMAADIKSADGFTSDNSTLVNVPFLFNVILSAPIPNSYVEPYIGAGVGPSVSEFDTDYFSDGSTAVAGRQSDAVFAGQIFAGLRFKIDNNMSLGFGYKYFVTGDPTFSYPPSPNWDVKFSGIRSHSVLFTFQWKFW